jgi:hypothetical protein
LGNIGLNKIAKPSQANETARKIRAGASVQTAIAVTTFMEWRLFSRTLDEQ